MKTSNYIYEKFNERGMKSFEKRVSTFLKQNGLKEGEAIALNAYMERGNGRGSYNKVAEIEINNEVYKLRSHTNDSEMWDFFEGTDKQKRQMFEAVLNEKISDLLEKIQENKENE
jgi:hypothetical protein